MAAAPTFGSTTSEDASDEASLCTRRPAVGIGSRESRAAEQAERKAAWCASIGRRLRLALLGELESDKKEVGDLTEKSQGARPAVDSAVSATPDAECLSECCGEAAGEKAARCGFFSFCCCAFPTLDAREVSASTVERLNCMRAFSHQLAGVRWLWSALHSPLSLAGCALADDPGLGSSAQTLTFLTISYEGGLCSAPSLIVVPGDECRCGFGRRAEGEDGEDEEEKKDKKDEEDEELATVGDIAVSQVRRWLRLCGRWTSRLRVESLLNLSQLAVESADADEKFKSSSSSFCTLPTLPLMRLQEKQRDHAAPADSAAVWQQGGLEGRCGSFKSLAEARQGSAVHIYVSTYGAILRKGAALLRLLRKQHDSLAFIVSDTRSLCGCRDFAEAQRKKGPNLSSHSTCEEARRGRQRCSFDLESENAALYELNQTVQKLWIDRAKPQFIVITNKFDGSSYKSLRLLLPLFLPQVFESPQDVDRSSETDKDNPEAFARKCIFPAVLRRTRKDVLIPAQPSPVRRREEIDLTAVQRQVYAQVEAQCVEGLLRVASGEAEPKANSESVVEFAEASSIPPESMEATNNASEEDCSFDQAQLVAARVAENMRLVSIHPALVLSCKESASLSKTNSRVAADSSASSSEGTNPTGGLVDAALLEASEMQNVKCREQTLGLGGRQVLRPFCSVISQALVGVLQITLPQIGPTRRRCVCIANSENSASETSRETTCEVCEERRRGIFSSVQQWPSWYAIHTARILGVETPQSIQRRLLRDSGKLQWLCAFLSGIRLPFSFSANKQTEFSVDAQAPLLSEAAALGAAAASELLVSFSKDWKCVFEAAESGEEGPCEARRVSFPRVDRRLRILRKIFAKVVLVSALQETADERGSVGLIIRDSLFPRPLVIDQSTKPAEAVCIVKDFLRAETSQCQVLVVDSLRPFFHVPPHLLASVFHVVWLSPPEGEMPRHLLRTEATGADVVSLRDAVEEHFFSVVESTKSYALHADRQYPFNAVYLVARRSIEDAPDESHET